MWRVRAVLAASDGELKVGSPACAGLFAPREVEYAHCFSGSLREKYGLPLFVVEHTLSTKAACGLVRTEW